MEKPFLNNDTGKLNLMSCRAIVIFRISMNESQ